MPAVNRNVQRRVTSVLRIEAHRRTTGRSSRLSECQIHRREGSRRILRITLPTALLLLAIGGCSDGSGGNGTDTGSIAPDSGFITLGITDAPVDDAAEVVVVVVTGVELQRGPENTITINFDSPKRIDLLRYRDGVSFNLLDNQAVLPGNYQWLRLRITAEQNLQSGSYTSSFGMDANLHSIFRADRKRA